MKRLAISAAAWLISSIVHAVDANTNSSGPCQCGGCDWEIGGED